MHYLFKLIIKANSMNSWTSHWLHILGNCLKKTFKEAIDPNEFKRQADVLVGFAILKLS